MEKKQKISMIAAIGARTRALGRNNDLIWRISDDLKRFKQITRGHPIIMGSKTYESIGRVLPDRTNIILTRDTSYHVPGGMVAHSMEDALDLAKKEKTDEIFIIGGGEVFKNALPITDKLYLTLVDDDADGDVFFPPYDGMFSINIFEERHPEHVPPFTWIEIEKKES